jgi:hypothetical protein
VHDVDETEEFYVVDVIVGDIDLIQVDVVGMQKVREAKT